MTLTHYNLQDLEQHKLPFAGGHGDDSKLSAMTAMVNAQDNHMPIWEQVLKKNNVTAGLKEILNDLVYEAFAKVRPEASSRP